MNAPIASVIISEYDPHWKTLFEQEKARLSKEIEKYVLAIKHIGSTAIPGMAAKPEIDIIIGVAHLADAEKCIKPLERLGYVYFPRFKEQVPERRYFRKSKGITPLFHIHMVEQTSTFWQEHIAFRDYLRAHPDVVAKYSALKKSLLAQFDGGRKQYSEKKRKFVVEVLKQIAVEKPKQ